MPGDDFDRYIAEMPEPKLELYNGRLVVGNDAGNLVLLRHLLEGWGAEAAMPMAEAGLWWQALHQGFQSFGPPDPDKPASVWRAWAAQLILHAAKNEAGLNVWKLWVIKEFSFSRCEVDPICWAENHES